MKHLCRLLKLIKLVLRDFAGCNQLAHLLLRVALKRRLELLKLLPKTESTLCVLRAHEVVARG